MKNCYNCKHWRNWECFLTTRKPVTMSFPGIGCYEGWAQKEQSMTSLEKIKKELEERKQSILTITPRDDYMIGFVAGFTTSNEGIVKLVDEFIDEEMKMTSLEEIRAEVVKRRSNILNFTHQGEYIKNYTKGFRVCADGVIRLLDRYIDTECQQTKQAEIVAEMIAQVRDSLLDITEDERNFMNGLIDKLTVDEPKPTTPLGSEW